MRANLTTALRAQIEHREALAKALRSHEESLRFWRSFWRLSFLGAIAIGGAYTLHQRQLPDPKALKPGKQALVVAKGLNGQKKQSHQAALSGQPASPVPGAGAGSDSGVEDVLAALEKRNAAVKELAEKHGRVDTNGNSAEGARSPASLPTIGDPIELPRGDGERIAVPAGMVGGPSMASAPPVPPVLEAPAVPATNTIPVQLDRSYRAIRSEDLALLEPATRVPAAMPPYQVVETLPPSLTE